MNSIDFDLVKKIRNGEQEAFKILYLKYSDLLFTYLLHHLGNNRELATDIWQETWCVAVEKIDNFQMKSSFFTWLCSIAKNKIYDHYRQSKRQGSMITTEKLPIDIAAEEINDDQFNSEIQANVVFVLANLKSNYIQLLTDKYIENRSTEEIALAIGRSYKATESMLTRAREAFRKEFKQINSKS